MHLLQLLRTSYGNLHQNGEAGKAPVHTEGDGHDLSSEMHWEEAPGSVREDRSGGRVAL